MLRSHINTLLTDAEDFLAVNGCSLPSFAFLEPADLEHSVANGECEEIARRGLGWMVTDYRNENFASEGSISFILRCGNYHRLGTGRGKLYAQSYLILRGGQNVPCHFHQDRTKDIVNKSGGKLCLRLYPSPTDKIPAHTGSLEVASDGQRLYMEPGAKMVLQTGASVTVEAGISHEIWAETGDVLANEISIAGNLITDSIFSEEGVNTVPNIEEDEPPRRLLVCDYPDRFPELARD